jgi:hypothetical protein
MLSVSACILDVVDGDEIKQAKVIYNDLLEQ